MCNQYCIYLMHDTGSAFFSYMFVVYRCAQSERTMRENTNAEEEQRKSAKAESERRMRETTNAEEEKRKSAPAESERRMRETTNAEEEKRKTAQAQEQAALAQQKSSAAKIELENKRLQVRKDQNKAEIEKHEQLQVNKRATTIELQKQIRLTEEAKQKTLNAETAKFHMLNLVLETFAKMDRELALAVARNLGAVASVQSNTVSHPHQETSSTKTCREAYTSKLSVYTHERN